MPTSTVRLISKQDEIVKEYTEQDDILEKDPPSILNLDGRYFTFYDMIGEDESEYITIYRETDCHPVSGSIIVT
jgi:hypothetical protein